MSGATGRGQQRCKRQAVGTGAAMIVELIGDVRAGVKMRVRVRLGAQLRNEQRQRHEQRKAQVGCLAQDFQKCTREWPNDTTYRGAFGST